ncbi:MAG: YihA family ribosome biogenesis GTP-binding protein [Flavobacteriales bacterium]|nr:YihA family ribosome biogenesis GTP-binding protein [Flavobacteriales bacterium]
MTIKSAKFIKSSATLEQMKETDTPEFAFIGRSNVGKSSLINMLANQKHLAKTSSKPGKTQLINQFLIDENWLLVDLPGYGFAEVSSKKKAKFSDMIMNYLCERKNLFSAFILIDCRLEPQNIDLEFVEWCGVKQIPFQIIFTKADKMKPTALANNIELFKAAMYKQGWEELPEFFVSSSQSHAGKEEILKFITQLILNNGK